MIKEAVGFGATIDEAKENALRNLGASDFDDVQYEVVSMPKKKVLGMFGGKQAEVKAFIEIEEKKTVKPKKNQNKQNSKKDKKEKVVAKKEKPVQAEKTAETKPEITEKCDYGEPIDENKLEENSPAKKAVAYIREILKPLNCGEISIKVASKENASLIIVDGEDISILIGRRGETLDAIQYLTSLAANNSGSHYKISLNIGNYREKREEALSALAKRIAEQVLSTGKSRALEPMNPYERRIIHTTIQEIDGVVSNSFGEQGQRRIVISKEGVPVKPPRTNDNRSRNRRTRSNQNKKNDVVTSVAREPKKDSDIPLYGKIN